ncbi:Uncharacterised protein [Mycobacteroides abscessus]|nr:Uncharacterised protein [Mycobacteroides abscessus]
MARIAEALAVSWNTANNAVLADNGFQRPPQSTPRQLGTWFGHPGGVLSPHVGAAGAPVATDGHQQCGGAPPERLMGQSTGEAVAWDAFFAAATTPPVLVGHPARQHSTAGLKALSGHLQPKFVEAAESRQVSAGEARPTGSVRHVEVFRMRSVGTLIFERPRPLSRQRRANHLYTLICEEPLCPAVNRRQLPLRRSQRWKPRLLLVSSDWYP